MNTKIKKPPERKVRRFFSPFLRKAESKAPSPPKALPRPITKVDDIKTRMPSHSTVLVRALVPFHSRSASPHNAAKIMMNDMCSDQLENS